MAYKFQLGEARLSGSVIQEGNVTAQSSQMSASTIALGDASGIAGTNMENDAGTLRLSSSIAGSGLTGGGADALSVELSGTDSGLNVGANGIEIKLSGSTGLALDDGGLLLSDIPNASLANAGFVVSSSVTGEQISLGDTVKWLGTSNEVEVAYAAANNEFTIGLPDDVTIGQDLTVTRDLTVNGTASITGDLEVNGSLTYVNTTNLKVKDALVTFASGTSAFGTGRGFELGTGTADEGNFKTASGSAEGHHFASSLPISASAFFGDGAELFGVSADTTTGIRLNQGYTTGSAAQSLSSAGFHPCQESQLVDNVVLHLSGTYQDGDIIIVKAPEDIQTYNISVHASGAQGTIDGFSSIVLESDNAAVSMLYFNSGGDDFWMIF